MIYLSNDLDLKLCLVNFMDDWTLIIFIGKLKLYEYYWNYWKATDAQCITHFCQIYQNIIFPHKVTMVWIIDFIILIQKEKKSISVGSFVLSFEIIKNSYAPKIVKNHTLFQLPRINSIKPSKISLRFLNNKILQLFI